MLPMVHTSPAWGSVILGLTTTLEAAVANETRPNRARRDADLNMIEKLMQERKL